MNFFEQQDRSHRKTKLLVFLFILAIVSIFLAIHTLMATCFSINWLDPMLILYDFLGVAFVVGGGSLFKTLELSQSKGEGIATTLGGELLTPSASNSPKERQLLNIVDELSIAAGIQVPKVYLLRQEPAINAFAAGFSANEAVVGVTQGALDYLNRDELQGVIGHEFSHILNGDMRINLRLIGILFGLEMIVFLGLIIWRNTFYIALASDNRRDNDKGGLAIVLGILALSVGLIIIGYIGLFFSNLIRMAISRQREFLADASSVQFTRNPDGMAGALKKIGGLEKGSMINNSHSVEACHLFFSNIFRPGLFVSLFATHPSLTQRIQRIDASFDGVFPENVQMSSLLSPSNDPAQKSSKNDAFSVSSVPLNVTLTAIVSGLGQINHQNLKVASNLLASIPDEIRSLIQKPESAKQVVLALLLSSRPDISQAQSTEPTQSTESIHPTELTQSIESTQPTNQNELNDLIKQLAPLPKQSRIPILQLAIPVLKQMSSAEYQQLRQTIGSMLAHNNKVNFFELTLSSLLQNRLDRHFGIGPAKRHPNAIVNDILTPFVTALSFLAYIGNKNPLAQKEAFSAGYKELDLQKDLTLLPINQCNALDFFKALEMMVNSTDGLKAKILMAFYACIINDGLITDQEGEMIRAISAIFDCPMPNFAQ